ncbi:MAG TPA: hypothetical protein VG273_16550 [Bryobacteraceae bacterium]|nr:hypothetical protein [Bryobacteraceae bacterium]
MPYERKSIQILGGSFNMLPPGDKTPVTDYLLAQNWRADRTGKLVSRYPYSPKFSISGAGLAHSAALDGGIQSGPYYVGCNDSLTTPTGSLYFNFVSTAIATGFDGNRIAMCPMNGWMWVMNRAKQGRHNVNASPAWQNWNLAAPSKSISSASASAPSPSTSVTYSYTAAGTVGTQHFLTVAGVAYNVFETSGMTSAQLAQAIAQAAQSDPNCSVTYSGSGSSVVIAPIPSNVILQVTGSDSNTTTNLAKGSVTSLPNGTYQYYCTFATIDDTLESNPGPVSAAVALSSQAAALTGVPTSGDGRVGKRNIYAAGGTLGQPYLVGTIPDNSTTSITISTPDLQATNNGVVMPTQNDAPPAAAGMIGPHFSRLFAWSTASAPHRLFYTPSDEPQYWPGSADPSDGNWINVGDEGEAILWCTIHGNTLVIYKERSIWMLVGDPSTGYLQQVRAGFGIVGQWGVVSAGLIDYLVGPGGVFAFNLDALTPVGDSILPLFTEQGENTGPRTLPGAILTGPAFNSTNLQPYAVSLGYAMGKLYIGYAENASSTQYCLLVYHEDSGRWFYHRNGISGATAFFGFIFDGIQMVGLTGSASGAALGENLDYFGLAAPAGSTDPGTVAIRCVYQSHYEDAGFPDNQKAWLEVVIDYEFDGDTATVYAGYDNGTTALSSLGTITESARTQKSFSLSGTLAKNVSIAIDCQASDGPVIIHNVHLYYYVEARLAAAASSLATDLGLRNVKQCKELELDIDATNGSVGVTISSDLPGNAISSRQTPTVAQAGRAVFRYPFSVTEGYLWKLALAANSGPFRLYNARLLMRPIGVYVEAYEAAAGFVWDSQEMTFDSGVTHIPRGYAISLAALPIKRAREISLEIETFNSNVTVSLLSDLPGDAQSVRFTATVNTGTAGRRFVRLPLPSGTSSPIEGRLFRLQISGSHAFRLYGAAIEILAVGVYIEAYEGAASPGAVYDSREIDCGSKKAKEVREIELDIETSGGSVTATLYSDIPSNPTPSGTPGSMSSQFTATVSTSGRQKILIPTTVTAQSESFVAGRLFQLIIGGSNAFRLYGASLKLREYGMFLTSDQAAGGGLWDSTPLDFDTAAAKALKRIEIDITTYGAVTVTILSSQGTHSPTSQQTISIDTSGARQSLAVNLNPGIRGRLIQVQITGSNACALYGCRLRWRPLNDAKGDWQWSELLAEKTEPKWTSSPLPVLPTEAQWFWARVLSVEETPETWTWVDVPLDVKQ